MTTKRTIKGSKAAIEHIQLAGQGIYDDGKYFRFEPEESGFGVVKPFKGNGSIRIQACGKR